MYIMSRSDTMAPFITIISSPFIIPAIHMVSIEEENFLTCGKKLHFRRNRKIAVANSTKFGILYCIS